MPYISTEALVGAALVAVLAFGYQHIPTRSATSGSAKSSKKKNKKKNKGVSEGESRIEPAVNTKGKQKREKGAPPKRDTPPTSTSTATAASTVTPNDLPVPVEPPTFAHKAGNAAPARAKTLAEKIAPKPRKTKVDDMLAPEDRPATHARVMKVVNSSTPTPTANAAQSVDSKVAKYTDDYASNSEGETSGTTGTVEAEVDDGWNVVPARSKEPTSIFMNSSTSRPTATAPLSVSTKIQKKNTKKAEMKKAAKEAEEADRQRRLAMHRNDLERERINEIYATSKKGGNKSTTGKSSGIAGATVDANGKLIWD